MPKRGKSGNKVLKPKQGTGSKRIHEPNGLCKKTTRTLTPLFSFKYLDNKFCLQPCETIHKAALIDKLRILGSLVWQAIADSPKEQYGFEMIPFEEIKATRPVFLTDDITRVMVFRFKGNDCRLAGHKQDRIFFIIYIDPHLELYDH